MLQEWPSNAALLRGTLRLRGGKGGGRRRVAHSTTKMSLKHLKGVVKKKAERENLNAQAADNSNIQARQRNVERKANNYGEDGGLWEIMDPHNKRGGEESREGKSQKEKRARLARKMIEAGTSDVSSERGDAGERLIVDYGDMKRAADKLEAEKNAPRPLPDEDDEEDSMPAFGELLRIPPPEALMENAAEISALAEAPLPIRGWRQNQDGPPTGALIVPDQCETLHEALGTISRRESSGEKVGGGLIWVREGNFSWASEVPSMKDRNALHEKRRRKAVFDWEYEPIDDDQEGKLWFDSHGMTYQTLDPVRPTKYVHPITGDVKEIPPAFAKLDTSRFVVVRRRNLRIQGKPAINASAPSSYIRYPRTRLEGQWILLEKASASFDGVLLAFYRPLMDNAEACMRALGGSWSFSRSGIHCGGHQCISAVGNTSLAFLSCTLGGFPPGLAGKSRMKRPATDALFLAANSSASLTNTTVSFTGLMHGAGVYVRDAARAVLKHCCLRNNRACALAVAGAGHVSAYNCLFHENTGSAFSACPDPELRAVDGEGTTGVGTGGGPSLWEDNDEIAVRASLLLQDCRVVGEPWPNMTRPGVFRESRNRYVPSREML